MKMKNPDEAGAGNLPEVVVPLDGEASKVDADFYAKTYARKSSLELGAF